EKDFEDLHRSGPGYRAQLQAVDALAHAIEFRGEDARVRRVGGRHRQGTVEVMREFLRRAAYRLERRRRAVVAQRICDGFDMFFELARVLLEKLGRHGMCRAKSRDLCAL